MTDCITLAHGSGGRDYRELVETIFAPAFHNEFLSPLTDARDTPEAVQWYTPHYLLPLMAQS